MRRKRVKKFFVTYIGPHRHMSLPPIPGIVVPGKEYEVPEKIANTLRLSQDWRVREKFTYIKVD